MRVTSQGAEKLPIGMLASGGWRRSAIATVGGLLACGGRRGSTPGRVPVTTLLPANFLLDAPRHANFYSWQRRNLNVLLVNGQRRDAAFGSLDNDLSV